MKNIAQAKSRLSIAVIGAGKVGSTFAYQLARAGHDVTVIARPGSLRFQQLQRDQAIILKTGERAEVRVADKLDEEAAYNLVVVTMPANHVDAVLPALLQQSPMDLVHVYDLRARAFKGRDRQSSMQPWNAPTPDGHDGQ